MFIFMLSACFVSSVDVRDAGDQDNDGFAAWQVGGPDCDDEDAAVHPDAAEHCDDGIDNDCDGVVDDFGVGQIPWFADVDGDAFGDAAEITEACSTHTREGWVLDDTDCDDGDSAIRPGVDDATCDGVDDNCDGTTDEAAEVWYRDLDGDGYGAEALERCDRPIASAPVDGDCDDDDANAFPGALEVCDAVDNDCDEVVDDEVATVAGVNYATLDLAVVAGRLTGDTLEVCPGTHTLQIVMQVLEGETLTLRGVQGADATTIVHTSSKSILHVWGDATLEGITVTDTFLGGALQVFDVGNLTVLDSVIQDPGMITVDGEDSGFGARLEVRDSEILNNDGFFGAAILILGNAQVLLTRTVLSGHEDNAMRVGAQSAADILLDHSQVTSNRAGVGAVGGPLLRVESVSTDWGTPGVDDNEDYDAFGQRWSGTASFVCRDRSGTFSCQ